jgi:excisionase family DNA binding protein
MPITDPRTDNLPEGDVLTLAEAAAYLRMADEKLLKLLQEGSVPGQLVGKDEWRLSKAGLSAWLQGPLYLKFGGPPWFHPAYMKEWLFVTERFLERFDAILKQFDDSFGRLDALAKKGLAATKKKQPKRGSREAIMPHFGALKDESGEDEFLESLHRFRKEGVEE